LQDVCKYGLNQECGLLINSSRGIIYAGDKEDFAQQSRVKALELQSEMEIILQKNFA
jgi:orotidine-5'-phosphate decarboxylase